jgi:hypothetical protein
MRGRILVHLVSAFRQASACPAANKRSSSSERLSCRRAVSRLKSRNDGSTESSRSTQPPAVRCTYPCSSRRDNLRRMVSRGSREICSRSRSRIGRKPCPAAGSRRPVRSRCELGELPGGNRCATLRWQTNPQITNDSKSTPSSRVQRNMWSTRCRFIANAIRLNAWSNARSNASLFGFSSGRVVDPSVRCTSLPPMNPSVFFPIARTSVKRRA